MSTVPNPPSEQPGIRPGSVITPAEPQEATAPQAWARMMLAIGVHSPARIQRIHAARRRLNALRLR